MPVRLLHFADLHLGVDNYGRLNPTTGVHSRLADFAHTLAFVFDTALEENVHLVVFSGDVYKTASPSPTAQREFARQLSRLREAGIPIVLIVGNHDSPAAFGRATSVDIFQALDLPDTHIVRAPRLLHLTTPGGAVQIAGLPWPSRHYLRAREEYREVGQEEMTSHIQQICEARINEFARELANDTPAVLAAHITAAEAVYSGSERTAIIGRDPALLSSALAHPAFDYVALGHIHRHQDLNRGQQPPVVYPGSVERIDFGEEGDDKGFCLVDLPTVRGEGASYRFVPTPARAFVTVTVPDGAVGESASDLTCAVVAAVAASPVKEAVVRISYPAPEGGGRLDLRAVREALREAHCVAGIVPRTPPRTRERRAAVTEHMDLPQALARYIENNPELSAEGEALRACALELARELDGPEAGDESGPPGVEPGSGAEDP